MCVVCCRLSSFKSQNKRKATRAALASYSRTRYRRSTPLESQLDTVAVILIPVAIAALEPAVLIIRPIRLRLMRGQPADEIPPGSCVPNELDHIVRVTAAIILDPLLITLGVEYYCGKALWVDTGHIITYAIDLCDEYVGIVAKLLRNLLRWCVCVCVW